MHDRSDKGPTMNAAHSAAMSLRARLTHGLRTWARDESGASMLEVSLVAPLLFLAFFTTLEFSYMKVREISLDRATDQTFRELRLGLINDPDHEKVKAAICANTISRLTLPDCATNLILEVREVPKANWSLPGEDPNCINTAPPEGYEPPIFFSAGAENQLMVARACLVHRPIMPPFGFVASIRRFDDQGNYGLVSRAAFVNEPS
ncbi:MAG: pilus assembly protein [Dinoroseobacter sp.]|nr:pilus assembly protein [Dinoroseobacter sp.]